MTGPLLENPAFLWGLIVAGLATAAVGFAATGWRSSRRTEHADEAIERAAKIASDAARDFRTIVDGRAEDIERFERIEQRLDALEGDRKSVEQVVLPPASASRPNHTEPHGAGDQPASEGA